MKFNDIQNGRLNSITETFHIHDVVFNLLQILLDTGWGNFWKKIVAISNIFIISLINIP